LITRKKINSLENKDNIVKEMKDKLSWYANRINQLTNEDKIEVIRSLVEKIEVGIRVENGIREPDVDIKWILSDLISVPSSLQIYSQINTKKNLPIIYDRNNVGILVANLRLRHNITAKKMATLLNVTDATLREIEKGNSRYGYYYYSKYCRHFSVDPYIYLDYYSLTEKTLRDRIEKLKAFVGSKSLRELDKFLGLYSGCLSDCLNKDCNKIKIDRLVTEKLHLYTQKK
jgi:transcriptional regulator with XRE-family HTH domain